MTVSIEALREFDMFSSRLSLKTLLGHFTFPKQRKAVEPYSCRFTAPEVGFSISYDPRRS